MSLKNKIILGAIVGIVFLVLIQPQKPKEYVPESRPISNSNNSNYIGKEVDDEGNRIDPDKNVEKPIEETTNKYAIDDPELFKVTFLNVGQADATFIEISGKTLLVDAGNRADGDDIVKFIKSRGYNSLDFLVGTHPHEDHMGGLRDVIEGLDVETLYMPMISEKHIPTTKFYRDLLTHISKTDINVISPELGHIIYQDEETRITVLNDTSKADNLNDYSIVIKVEYKNESILLTGDLEREGEERLIQESPISLKSTLFKAGHHGSNTSNTDELLSLVQPELIAISAEKDSSYGHPHKEVIDKYEKLNANYMETSKEGSILFVSDGNYFKYFTGITSASPLGDKWDGKIQMPSVIIFD